jgi:hypothetical protein
MFLMHQQKLLIEMMMRIVNRYLIVSNIKLHFVVPICICYGDGTRSFSDGFIDWKHVYTRISEHEN